MKQDLIGFNPHQGDVCVENSTRLTTCGQGECAGNTGIETCIGGMWVNDTCDPFAGATEEICDGLDNDCDGEVDEDVKNTYFLDSDEDGFGNPDSSLQACSPPAGYVADNTDCADGNAAIYPDAAEKCSDGIDNDCDTDVDMDDIECSETEPPTFSGLESAVLDCGATPVEIDLSWPSASDNITPQHQIRYVVCWDSVPLTYGSQTADCILVTGETTYSIFGIDGHDLVEDQIYYSGVTAYDNAANGAFNSAVLTVTVNCVP
jgi:hypothetical protein